MNGSKSASRGKLSLKILFCLMLLLAVSLIGVGTLQAEEQGEDEPTDPKTVFATLGSDRSLNFYYREATVPSVGDQYDGKTVKKVYTDFSKTVYTTSTSSRAPWIEDKANIAVLNIVDEGVPMPSGPIFYQLNQLKKADLTNFDTSTCEDITKLFQGCSMLEEVDISNIDTSKFSGATTSKNGSFFTLCNSLGKVTVGANWDLAMGQKKSGGIGAMPVPTAGLYSGNNTSFKGKYLTGKWTDGTNTYDDINNVPTKTAATYTWEIDESKSDTRCCVTFEANGGKFQKSVLSTSESEDVYCESGETVAAPSYPLDNGDLVFSGWYENIAGEGEAFDFSTPIAENKVLYAKWTEGALPDEWQGSDFTYNKAGDEITGLSSNGRLRIQRGQTLDLSKADSGNGTAVTGIADSSGTYGLFVFVKDNQFYAPLSVKFSDSMKKIGANAFLGFVGTSIELPSSLTTIGNNAFASSKLTSITIPGKIESVGENAFLGCTGLTSVTFATDTESYISPRATISSNAFKGCPLSSLTLAEGIKSIASGAFDGANETLGEITLPGTLETLDKATFSSTESETKVLLRVHLKLQLDNNKGIEQEGLGHTIEYVSDKMYTRITSVSGTGNLKLNGSDISNGMSVVTEYDKTITLGWSAGRSGNNVSLIKSIKVNGKELDPVSKMDKTKWQTANSEYKRRLKEKYNMTTFDKILSAQQTLSFNTADYVSYASSIAWSIDVEFAEYVPVYRLYNMITSEHLFTTDKAEYDGWVKKCEGDKDFWIGEGVDWLAPKTYDSKTTAKVYRLYNPALGAMGSSSHYYTSNESEVKSLTSKYGWKKETQFSGGYVFLSDKSSGATPIWTCYNEALRSAHHYTSDKNEWTGLSKHGWDLEKKKNGTTGVFAAVMSAKP